MERDVRRSDRSGTAARRGGDEIYVAEFVCDIDEGHEIDERLVFEASLDASAEPGALGVDIDRSTVPSGRRLRVAVEFASERARRRFWDSGAGADLVDALRETVPAGALANSEMTERTRVTAD
ncbi:hypothetical protein [Natronoarchaeum rubrum]|uniref:hypothetical protein n=1 Tax=Natronoarchaeum rubrum TaxID=755311 RepID=UPI002111B5C2|nr:hypothetical protein [Natronoarchaeum rubrum]